MNDLMKDLSAERRRKMREIAEQFLTIYGLVIISQSAPPLSVMRTGISCDRLATTQTTARNAVTTTTSTTMASARELLRTLSKFTQRVE